MKNGPLLVIMGPTASGKTSLSVDIAKHFSGEIVTADSMQVYRGLDIGTAKPDLATRADIPHHLVDIIDIEESLDVFKYVGLAGKAVDEILQSGKLPIICGGSGMYIRAFLYGLDPLPANRELRRELDNKYDSEIGFVKLKEFMSGNDPADFKRWHNHRRKLIRAMEVFTLTGKSITELQTVQEIQTKYPVISWNLCWDNSVLRERIERRCTLMLKSGWLEEAKKLLGCGILDSPTAHQVLGYRIIGDFLTEKIDYTTMEKKIVSSTWHLARRQMTWFRNKHPETENIHMPVDTDILIAKLEKRLGASSL